MEMILNRSNLERSVHSVHHAITPHQIKGAFLPQKKNPISWIAKPLIFRFRAMRKKSCPSHQGPVLACRRRGRAGGRAGGQEQPLAGRLFNDDCLRLAAVVLNRGLQSNPAATRLN